MSGRAKPAPMGHLSLHSAMRGAPCWFLITAGTAAAKSYINARGKEDTFNIAQMSKTDVESIISSGS